MTDPEPDDDGQPIPEGDRYPTELERFLGWAAANGATVHREPLQKLTGGEFRRLQDVPGWRNETREGEGPR